MKSQHVKKIGLALAGTFLFASVGMPQASYAAPAQVTIWTDLDRAQAFQSWAKGYNRAHSNVVVTVLGKDGLKEKLTTVADPDAPDIIVGAHDWIGPLKASNLIVPVTIANAKQFDDRDKTAFKLGRATYGLPLTVENIALFRNANMVPKAPKSMKEIEAISKKFLKKHKKALFTLAVSPGDAYHMYPLFSGLGGYVFGGSAGAWKTSNIGIDNKTFLKNAPLIDKWYKEKLINANVTGDTALAAFTSGAAPFYLTGPWNLDKIRLKNINYEISAFPSIVPGAKPVPFYGVQGAMVTKWAGRAKHNVTLQTAAVMNDLSSKKVQLSIANATIRTPANLMARKSFKDDDSSAFFAAGKGAITMPAILEMGLFWSNVAGAWSNVKQGNAVARFKKAAKTVRDKI